MVFTGSLYHPLSALAGVRALFVPRMAGIAVDTDRETALRRLAPAHAVCLDQSGFDPKLLATAGQVHGGEVAVVQAPGSHAGVDALVTESRGVVLGIYVADCAAVYLADRRGRAIALVHSGRAGTTAGITARTIALLQAKFGIAPVDLVVEISPCIRPPLYETDFAAEIAAQAREAGAGQIVDAGICTGREVRHYYSYRAERGRTGRMLAALQLRA